MIFLKNKHLGNKKYPVLKTGLFCAYYLNILHYLG